MELQECLSILRKRQCCDGPHSRESKGGCDELPECGKNDLLQGCAQTITQGDVSSKGEFAALSDSDLVSRFNQLQQERARGYHEFESLLHHLLETREPIVYSEGCASLTTLFSKISLAINEIESQFRNRKLVNLAKVIRALQEKEKDKLEVTAALQMEEIRMEAFNPDMISPEKNVALKYLRERRQTVLGSIVEILEEWRYETTDLLL